MAGFGYALQRLLLNRTLGGDILPPLLVTFGLSVVIQNALLETFSADSRKLALGGLETASLQVAPGLAVAWYPLLVLLAAGAVIGGLQLFLYRTEAGAALCATSDDPATAQLTGVDHRHMFAVAVAAAALAVAGMAGVLMAGWTNFDPLSGPQRLLTPSRRSSSAAWRACGARWPAASSLGVAQAVGAAIDPAWQVLAGHLAFLSVLLVAPRGLFPRMAG